MKTKAELEDAGVVPAEKGGCLMMNYPEVGLYVDGVWRRTAETQAVINPADETVVGQGPRASISDLQDAVEAA